MLSSPLPFLSRYVRLTVLAGAATLLAACSQVPPAPKPEGKPVLEVIIPGTEPDAGQDAEPDTDTAQNSVRVIFDTDLGFDCDDAGALALLHRLADTGEATLLATMSVVGDPQSAAALGVINSYYGRPETPVGAYQGDRWPDARPYWYDAPTDFLRPLTSEYESSVNHKNEVPDAVTLYRRTLAAQPDHSVTVVAAGFPLNLANLLASAADASSPLSGQALVAQKVKQLVYMGSRVDHGGANRADFNLGDGPYKDGRSAQKVLSEWPTDIVFATADVGDAIKTGESLRAQLPENPVARVYNLFPGVDAHGERASWDLTAALYAVRGGGDFWRVVRNEHLEVAANGVARWHKGAVQPGRYRLEQTGSSRKIEGALEALLN